MSDAPVTLTTDFGDGSSYVAAMKGVRPRERVSSKTRPPRAPTASPEKSHSLLPEKVLGFRPGLLTRCSLLPGRGLEVPSLENLLSLFARNEVNPLPG